MYINNFYRFMILMGLTFPIPLGILTPPVFAETGNLAQTTVTPTGATISYSFPNEGITYTTNGAFTYKGLIFQPKDINIVTSAIGKQITVTIANGVDTLTTFTLLLPNNPIQNSNTQITAVGIINNFVAPKTNNNSYTLLNGTASILTANPATN
ncbi:MAG: hypothetical protein V7K97_04605 [Nostoc sp.]|uniref:hypothetical protein n=1 Tax=Nostoc sp. TaxID=1180 RepID=UPI002FF6D539